MHEVEEIYTVVCQQLQVCSNRCMHLTGALIGDHGPRAPIGRRESGGEGEQARIKFYVQQFKNWRMCLMAFPLVSLLFQKVEYMTSHFCHLSFFLTEYVVRFTN